jgi:hypothetical protein
MERSGIAWLRRAIERAPRVPKIKTDEVNDKCVEAVMRICWSDCAEQKGLCRWDW